MQTPDGEAKMSAVILQLAEPLMKQHGTTAERAKALLMLTIAGWNKSMFSPDEQPLVENDLINAFVPKDGSAEAVAVAIEVMDIVAEHRQKLFPDLRKIIVDYDVEIGGGRLTLNVSSAPIPDLGQSETKKPHSRMERNGRLRKTTAPQDGLEGAQSADRRTQPASR